MRVKLSDVTHYSKGIQINGNDLIENGEYIYLNGGINPSGRWSSFNVSGNTITISEGGNSSGYINYITEPFWCGAHCYYLFNGPQNTKYLYYALKSQQERLFAIRSGACMPNIKKSDLGLFEFEFDYDEKKQDEIVSVLSSIEKIIDCRKREIQILDDFIKARFVEMFGDTVTNPLEWEEHNLDEYIKFLTSGSRGWSKYFVNKKSSIFITIKNVKNKHVSLDNIQYIDAPKNKEAERTKVKAGDLLISITADLGRTAVIDEDIASKGGYINQHLSLIRLDTTRLNPLYAAYFLETPGGKIQFESKNQTGVKAGINFDSIRSLKILVPPLCLQESYLDFVKQVDKSKVAVQAALDKAQMLFDSLMQEYFG